MVKTIKLQQILHSVVLYPVTITYVAGVTTLSLVVSGVARIDMGLVIFAVVSILVILNSTWKEVSKVHELVNSQHDAMVARIDQLLNVLEEANVEIPSDKEHSDNEQKS